MSGLNIYQKLVEVRKSCEYLKKDNKGYQFSFVSSSQTLGTLRKAMDEQNLLLVPGVTSHETRDHTTAKGAHEYFTIATMEYTWINADKPEERISCPWLGHGLDSGEKGVGKAMTYAEKYFLLKFFNIATDKDDPDSFQEKAHKGQVVQEAPPLKQPEKAHSNPAGDYDGWKVVALAEIKKGRSRADWWAEHKGGVIGDCGEKLAKKFHKEMIANG